MPEMQRCVLVAENRILMDAAAAVRDAGLESLPNLQRWLGAAPFDAGELEGTVSCRDHEWIDGEHFTGFAASVDRSDRFRFGPPDHQPGVTDIGEGSGIRIGDSADEIENLFRGLRPEDAAVLGFASAEVRGVRVVLRRFFGGACEEGVNLPGNYSAGAREHFAEGLFGGVARADARAFLIDDGAGIGAFHHAVKRHADARLTVEDGPVDGGTAPVFWEE